MSRDRYGVAGDPPRYGWDDPHGMSAKPSPIPVLDGTLYTTTAPKVPAPLDLHHIALRLSTAYALAADAGHGEVDRWKNVALVAKRLAAEGRLS